MESTQLPNPKPPDDSLNPVISAWNMMEGKIEWEALDVLCEMLGVDDPDLFIRQLLEIRDFYRARRD